MKKMLFRLAFLALSLGVGLGGAVAANAMQYVSTGTVSIRYSYNSIDGMMSGNANLVFDSKGQKSGYDFLEKKNTNVSDGSFYVAYQDGKLQFFANNYGQGGLRSLKSWATAVPDAYDVEYTNLGLEVKNGAVYAVYDQDDDNYIKVQVQKITRSAATAVVDQESDLGVPKITAPKENQNFPNYPRKVTATWTAAKYADRYELQLDCDICGDEPWGSSYVYTTKDKSTKYPLTLPGDQEFRIRVRAVAASGISGVWSPFRYFHVNKTYLRNHAGLSAPQILTPETDQTISNNNRVLSMSWSAVYPTVAGYNIEVECAESCDSLNWKTLTAVSTETTQTMMDGIQLPADGYYRARVQAVQADAFNVVGYWSPYVYFHVASTIADPLPPPTNLPTFPQTPAFDPKLLNYTVDYGAQAANLSWLRDRTVTAYQMQIDCNGCGDNRGWASYMDTSIDPTATWYMSTDQMRTEVRVGIPENRQYRFRVRATAATGGASGVWSDYLYLTFTKPTQTSLVPFALLTPATLDSSGLTLSWSPVSGARQYTVNIYCADNSCLERMVDSNKTTITDSYTLPGKEYRVFVRAQDSNYSYFAITPTLTVR